MTESEFWALVTRTSPQQDQTELADALKQKLSLLSNDELRDFDKIFGQQMRRSYSWSVWGAAYVITGCDSEYAFAEFRCFLISLGQEWYDKVVESADELGKLELWPEKDGYAYPFVDEYDLIAGQLYEERNDDELPYVPSGQATPAGKKFSHKKKQLKATYPLLSAAFPF
ncbi:DUF4240 domain-containing protein [Shewanella fidelis]|uniref:DUF4240 domain-containing protein n=1 Tax=Shewanella fidelis TaxID=173509 RepID=A0AAW8NK83_9GAMM|nr:DUF4240 domain-containing protein [Shewanella fidelis]MDR8522189.1 DUF4240 domain-containing protein [Shewanella fidelis]MDW4812596.1 DUF4240 domain-containing protein [Shewanella fidelis]MDW4816344.1 DUF4240 domain-containing protein [Shewanella fidelis]MDW4820837.1 DUF4240 domain-containing protein [Shewanella fidelis]MDW4825060.1 DUF4240 domain-containing protein [Shewanella fidelis]